MMKITGLINVALIAIHELIIVQSLKFNNNHIFLAALVSLILDNLVYLSII